MNQNELKKQAAKAALKYVNDGEILGVGTGSTVDFFIEALALQGKKPAACVSSSMRSSAKLQSLGFKVIDLNELDTDISVYVDGADEINDQFEMIKGGGGALTREKIVAAASKTFVCIADAGKKVQTLGAFPLPVEVIPMAVNLVARRLKARFGGTPIERDFTTDNGNRILDIQGLHITQAKDMEKEITMMAGVVTCGLFAMRPADILLLGGDKGVEHFER